jgi:DnaJ family protein A protein 2
MSQPSIDLYEIIDVPKTATEEEIKKAYKKKAVKLHPDRNPNNPEEANRQFQELNRAAKILGNPESRRRYDQFGVIDGEGDAGGSGMSGGFNPFDLFGNIFHGGNMSGGIPGFFGGGSPGADAGRTRNAKSPDKKITVNLSLADVYQGKQVPLDFVKVICCDQCNGLGAKSADCIISCNICNGKGRVVKVMQMGPIIQQLVQPCGSCAGIGKMTKSGGECGKCSGKKTVSIKRHLDCYVRPGSSPGTSITFKNEADWVADFSDIGDLIVYVNCKNEDMGFYREGDNLIMKRNISLLESLTGSVIYFKHLDNRIIKVAYNEIIHPGQKMVIKNEGMPNLADNLVRGDLILIFEIQFPQILDKERAKYLVKILPQPKKQIWDLQMEKLSENEVTIHTMQPFQDNQTGTTHDQQRQPRTPFTDGSDDDIPMSGGPIECTTQ